MRPEIWKKNSGNIVGKLQIGMESKLQRWKANYNDRQNQTRDMCSECSSDPNGKTKFRKRTDWKKFLLRTDTEKEKTQPLL